MLSTHTGVDGGAPQAGLEGPEHGGDAVHLPVRQHAGRGGHRRANLQKYLHTCGKYLVLTDPQVSAAASHHAPALGRVLGVLPLLLLADGLEWKYFFIVYCWC